VADLAEVAFALGSPTRLKAQSDGALRRSAMRNVALDLGVKKICVSEVLNQQVVRRATVRGVAGLVEVLGPDQGKARVALEACREAWHVHDKLRSWGHEVIVVDTTRVREIGVGQHGKKNDRLDADVLALALERDQIPKAHVLSPERRRLREQLNVRRMVVEQRAQTITTIRGIVRGAGQTLKRCGTDSFLETYRKAKLPDELRLLLAPAIAVLETLEAQLSVVEDKLFQLCDREPAVPLLCSTPGVSIVVAAAFVSVVDEPGRFKNAHQVESYVGLVPKEDTTGGKQRLGRITKAGNSYLRAVLVQAAWCILRQRGDDPLKQWGDAIAKRRCKRIAAVALARRLVGVLWAMWRKNTVYDPALLGTASAHGLALQAQTTAARAVGMQRATQKLARRRPRRRASSSNERSKA
jgi:transposase